mmetsp:Transcript_32908/g.72684  ORF Transcript_32908/g.72684 Transcript_32908/m.72684 type:complete len:410 (-) Transcript_32908:761-1990(-)|eukprot:CAMPEP_0202896192 /NCGR_PEP_ID=MMETSP1392-20130828/5228_1 /ASSEMBLY_ACC=CAM_ASM_000868 /TAXON_ID=225041 /ORGANISM="Chlamydomonas chlamydogama, Strain SAG 11-48b" /LENGTH=409 /DNA_ID=CAMNT_0049581445 /DNA_START=87 /DNA_END=1316 /DNA_ORIENTATION=-
MSITTHKISTPNCLARSQAAPCTFVRADLGRRSTVAPSACILLDARGQTHKKIGTITRRTQRLASRAYAVSVLNLAPAPVVLCGDIGGTNARLAVWTAGPARSEIYAKTYPTANYKTFEDALNEFLGEGPVKANPPQAACLAIAGAVENNKCPMTNLSWLIDGDALGNHHGIKVALLNDFEAVGYGIPALDESDLVVLNDAPRVDKAPKVVMGPGTGLGAAQLMWDEGKHAYKVWPGEGAHATFAPRGWKQKALAKYVSHKYHHCEIEQVACGSGLELIYEFLLTDEPANRPELLHGAKPKSAADISAAALAGTDPLAVEAVDMFLAIVGAEAGAMALRCLAKGGVYIAGGITPKLMQRVKAGSLLEGFLMRKGRERFHEILKTIPLYVITNTKVGQIGAVEYAANLLH